MSVDQLERVRKLVRDYTARADTGWLGVAPSYLVVELGVSYAKARVLLRRLQDDGFVYDNRNGTPQGPRFYLTEQG